MPLSVDIEGGYTDERNGIAETAARFIEAGAVGFNIQDASASPHVLCRKIEQIRETAVRLGVGLYINARTDVYARNLVRAGLCVREVLTRATQYSEAGADGLFVLGVTDRDEIAQIASGMELLLNVIAWPGLPRTSELAALGVRRVSVGS
ncbi:isocitrate lyase/phosphoenolpyruvate mutase family protein [Ensifer canadensis]